MDSLQKAFKSEEAITLLLDRGALFIEKHPVGERFNPRRLLNLLAQTKIESFTFGRDVRLTDLQALLDILSHQDKYNDVDAVKAEFSARDGRNIRINYVTYKKVTADQKVVSEDEQSSLGNLTGNLRTDNLDIQVQMPAREDEDFGSMASMLSITELIKDPSAYAKRLGESDENKEKKQQVVRQLRHLISQIESGELTTEGALSSKELLQSVNNLRDKVRRQHAGRRDVERLLGEDNQVLGEVDQLTYSTLVSLVREEYRGGNFSAKRMAQIINRMLPDSSDLRRLLPQLKQGLLGEGMSVADYGKLVNHLSGEVRGDHVVRALETGAESVGLDVDEIVDQIREDPSEAARLIVMATELRRAGVDDQDQLSTAFSDYIQRVSERLALDFPQQNRDGSDATAVQLERVRKFLIDQLSRQGLQEDLTIELKRRSDGPGNVPGKGSSTGPSNRETKRSSGGTPETAQSNSGQPVEESVASSDIESDERHATGPRSKEQSTNESLPLETPSAADSLIEKYPAKDGGTGESSKENPKTANSKLKLPTLSQRVLNPANTAFFLKREIKSAQRYKTIFSVIKISIEYLRQPAGVSRRPTAEELFDLLPAIYEGLVEKLRDLDLIGSLEPKLQSVPLLILPMTDESGANIVRWRLTDYLRDQVFDAKEAKLSVITTLTSVTFDPSSEEKGRAFIQRLQNQHEQNRSNLENL